jgi:hypothetical protein
MAEGDKTCTVCGKAALTLRVFYNPGVLDIRCPVCAGNRTGRDRRRCVECGRPAAGEVVAREDEVSQLTAAVCAACCPRVVEEMWRLCPNARWDPDPEAN